MVRPTFAVLPFLVPLALAGACGGSAKTSASSGSGSGSSSSSGGGGGGGGGAVDPASFAAVNKSCAYACPLTQCAEQKAPYACQNLDPWAQIPHADTCGPWDGTYPTPAMGRCSATVPAGDAIKLAGVDPDDATVRVMPDGRRLSPAGVDFVFTDPETMTANVVPVAGTKLVLTVDLGYGDHIVRAVDSTQIAGAKPVLGQVDFTAPEALNQGLSFSPPDRVFVAGAQGVVQALTLDVATGVLTRNDAGAIPLPASPLSPGGVFYSSGVAVSTDNTRLFVSGVKDSVFIVADVTAAGPTYGKVIGQVDLGAAETFNVYVDPNDPTTHFAYVTLWASRQVLEVDVSTPAAPKVARSFAVGADPQGLVFLDARWAVVGDDLGDSLSILDRTTGTVTTVPVEVDVPLHGFDASSLAWDPAASRLYVTQAGYNAVAGYDVDLTATPPTIVPAGRLPTQWWPSGVVVMADGSLVVTSIAGHGTGPTPSQEPYMRLSGGIQRVPTPSASDLTAGEAKVQQNNDVAARSGQPQVQCPAGASDFPIPPTNTGGPSPVIDHVFVVVRENKNFDDLLGDFPGVKGDPTLTLLPSAQMDGIWTNLRKLARTFAHSDNFYTSAYISEQGHVWTTYGRSNDFTEREWWMTGYGRNVRGATDSGGFASVGRPVEGSVFDWLGNTMVPYDILGEIVGNPTSVPAAHNPIDPSYPGGIVQNIGYPDVEKACYVAGRARVLCDVGKVVYMTLPNDHTRGVGVGVPTPETMFAVNDEATGMVIDGISHSPLWKSSLVAIVEDDPGQGGAESIDAHRTILVMASPWLKRAYVSHTHIDISSVHKLIAHILALPYPNVEVANAALPLDMFTSTPDYTPYTYEKRTYSLVCGTSTSLAESRLTASWDFDDADAQPGLDAQVGRWLRGQQLTELTPKLEREIAERERARARREQRDDP